METERERRGKSKREGRVSRCTDFFIGFRSFFAIFLGNGEESLFFCVVVGSPRIK